MNPGSLVLILADYVKADLHILSEEFTFYFKLNFPVLFKAIFLTTT